MTASQSVEFPIPSGRLVFDASEVEEGDIVAYPGLVRERARRPYAPERNPRDWILVSKVELGFIRGERVNPEDWEVGQEYAIYPTQIRDNGVEVAA